MDIIYDIWYILGVILGYVFAIGFIVLCIATFNSMLGLAFPKLRKKKDDDSD